MGGPSMPTEMIELAVLAQMRNVARGRTADGYENELSPLTFPESEEVWQPTARALAIILTASADPSPALSLSDETRTDIMRKLMQYRASKPGAELTLRLLQDTGHLLRQQPRYISGPSGMDVIFKIAHQEASRQRANTRWQELFAKRLEKDANPPPRRIVWQEGPFRLEALEHPFHVWEEGWFMDNCLSRLPDSDPDRFVADAISVEKLPTLPYWQQVAEGGLEILSLRTGDKRLAAIAHTFSDIYELHVIDETSYPVLAAALHAYGKTVGPFGFRNVARDQMIKLRLTYFEQAEPWSPGRHMLLTDYKRALDTLSGAENHLQAMEALDIRGETPAERQRRLSEAEFVLQRARKSVAAVEKALITGSQPADFRYTKVEQ